ncbi:MAG: hypothetical protein EPO32_04180 [Anaerolineae bacterium]|nr:MAG: hypothetical protein EPO32_04180 [Anaerolineae bacterium]
MKFKSHVSLLFIGALLLTSCIPATPESLTPTPVQSAHTPAPTSTVPTHTAEPDVVTIAAQNLISHMPLYIADLEGYFAEQNIVVEFIAIETGVEVLPILAADEIDVVAGALNVGLLNLMAQDDTVRIVADKGYTDPAKCSANAVMARSDLLAAGELETADQLKSRIILANPVGISGYVLERWLNETYGPGLNDVTVERLPRAAQIDALNNGAAAIVVASEPNITQFAELAGVEIVADFGEYLPGASYANILFGKHLRIDDPELGQRFMVAYLKAVRQYMEGPTPRNIELIAQVTELEPEFIQRVCFPTIRLDGWMDYAATVSYIQWELDADRISVFNTEEQFWDSRFVDFASSQLD